MTESEKTGSTEANQRTVRSSKEVPLKVGSKTVHSRASASCSGDLSSAADD